MTRAKKSLCSPPKNLKLGLQNHYSVGDITQVMNALRIIGGNINQIAKKANETHNVNTDDVEKLKKEVDVFSHLKGVISDTERNAEPVKAHYNKCALLLKEYSDIATTYNEISQGDYILKLIEQQRKQDVPKTRPRR